MSEPSDIAWKVRDGAHAATVDGYLVGIKPDGAGVRIFVALGRKVVARASIECAAPEDVYDVAVAMVRVLHLQRLAKSRARP